MITDFVHPTAAMPRPADSKKIVSLQTETWEIARQIAFFLDGIAPSGGMPRILSSNQMVTQGLAGSRIDTLVLKIFGLPWEQVTKVLDEVFPGRYTPDFTHHRIDINCSSHQPLRLFIVEEENSHLEWFKSQAFKIKALSINPLTDEFFDPLDALNGFQQGTLEFTSLEALERKPDLIFGTILLSSRLRVHPSQEAIPLLVEAVRRLKQDSSNFLLSLQTQLIKEEWITRIGLETIDMIGLRDDLFPMFKDEDLLWLEFLRLARKVEAIPGLNSWYVGSNKLPILSLIMLTPIFRREIQEMSSMRSHIQEFLQRYLPLIGPALAPPNAAIGIVEDCLYAWLLTKKKDLVWTATQEPLRVTYTFAQHFFELLKLPNTAFSHLQFSTGNFSLPHTHSATTTDVLDIFLDSSISVGLEEPLLKRAPTQIRKQRRQSLTIPYTGVLSFLLNHKRRLVTVLDYEARTDISDEQLLRLDGTVQILSRALHSLHSKGFPKGKEFVLRIIFGNELPYNNKCPLFCFAKPSTWDRAIALPDWSFTDNYSAALPSNWDILRQEVNKNVTLTNLEERMPTMFCRGRTTENGYGIRDFLSNCDDPFLKVSTYTDSLPQREPIYSWVKYKYLLDIPESIPWTTGFKELFLLRGVVIKVNPITSMETSWVSFYTERFIKGEDYLALDYIVPEHEDAKEHLKRLKGNLERIFTSLENNPEGAQEIANRGYNKALKISERLAIEYAAWLIGNYYRNYWEHEDYGLP